MGLPASPETVEAVATARDLLEPLPSEVVLDSCIAPASALPRPEWVNFADRFARKLFLLAGDIERLRRRGGAATDALDQRSAAVDIWTAEGVPEADSIPALTADQFIFLADKVRRTSRDAR